MGNWFSQESRGLVFGFWCTCQNIGNIGGNILVGVLRDSFGMSWMWSLRIIGIWIGVLAIFNFFLLIDNPKKVGLVIELPEEAEDKEEIEGREPLLEKDGKTKIQKSEISSSTGGIKDKDDEIKEQLIDQEDKLDLTSSNLVSGESSISPVEEQGISFWKAWLLPGVIPYAICIAFVKSATYGMLLWLPTYAEDELNYPHSKVQWIAIINDIGTIFGSVLLGKLSDITYK